MLARTWQIALAATSLGWPVLAADAAVGRRIAQEQCSSCHGVVRTERNEVADSPPFTVIGEKYRFDVTALAAAIRGPHPKMNFTPSPAETEDVAAYISTLRR
jgi:mono/diheme cytochrome c family protein